jgi:hypothetical protein
MSDDLISSEASAVPIDNGALPGVKPVEVVLEDTAVEMEEERGREEAYAGVYVWKEKELMPLTPSVKGLWEQLCAADGQGDVMLRYASLEAFGPSASKILFLLTHKPESYQGLRRDLGAFVRAIDVWWDETVGFGELVDSCALALKVVTDANRNMVVPKPMEGRRGDVGE